MHIKNLLIGLLIFIAVFLLIGVALPSTTQLSESILINAPADMVFEEVNNLKQWENWSPWQKNDLSVIMHYEGPDLGVGSKMVWDSKNPKVGKGSQEIIKSIPNRHIEIALSFAGWDHTSQANWDFEEQDGNSTQVTWSYASQIGGHVLHKYAAIMIKSSLKKDYKQGLQQLKAHIEQKQAQLIGKPKD